MLIKDTFNRDRSPGNINARLPELDSEFNSQVMFPVRHMH